jgi:hypothetical protein
MSPLNITITPEQQAAMQERVAGTVVPFTRAFVKLSRSYRFGSSADHPGLIDTTAAATNHMGGLLEQLRALNEARVADLRAANSASAVTPPQ